MDFVFRDSGRYRHLPISRICPNTSISTPKSYEEYADFLLTRDWHRELIELPAEYCLRGLFEIDTNDEESLIETKYKYGQFNDVFSRAINSSLQMESDLFFDYSLMTKSLHKELWPFLFLEELKGPKRTKFQISMDALNIEILKSIVELMIELRDIDPITLEEDPECRKHIDAMKIVNATMDTNLPSLSFAGAEFETSYSATEAIIGQLACSLCDKTSVKVCAQCGGKFQYKSREGGVLSNYGESKANRQGKYCSEECAAEAVRQYDRDRKRKAREAKKK